MAFTDTQKAQIRRYLGYPDVFRYANTRLESAIDVIGARSEVQAMVESDLAALAAIETKLSGTVVNSAGVKRVDEIEFFQSQALKDIRSEGRRICGRMSVTFGVPLASDVFGSGGYAGDSWMGTATQYGGTFGLG